MGAIEIRPAEPEELDVAMEILEEATSWTEARGLEGWEPGTYRDPEGRGRRALLQALEAGHLHLAWRDGRAVATVTLQWSDQLFWPRANPDAGYVHRLAIRDQEHGRGLGRLLLAWTERTSFGEGKSFLRLDCAAGNPGIRTYYERAGFRHVRDIQVPGFLASLYEKPVESPGRFKSPTRT